MSDEEEVYEVHDICIGSGGVPEMHYSTVSGLHVVRGLKSVSLECQITRADGTAEPQKLLSKTTTNLVTNKRLREEGVGEVTIKQCG